MHTFALERSTFKVNLISNSSCCLCGYSTLLRESNRSNSEFGDIVAHERLNRSARVAESKRKDFRLFPCQRETNLFPPPCLSLCWQDIPPAANRNGPQRLQNTCGTGCRLKIDPWRYMLWTTNHSMSARAHTKVASGKEIMLRSADWNVNSSMNVKQRPEKKRRHEEQCCLQWSVYFLARILWLQTVWITSKVFDISSTALRGQSVHHTAW